MVSFTRKELYEMMWLQHISPRKMAEKYNLSYPELLKSLDKNNIPRPTLSFWSRIQCGYDVSELIEEFPGEEDVKVQFGEKKSAENNDEEKNNPAPVVSEQKQAAEMDSEKDDDVKNNPAPVVNEQKQTEELDSEKDDDLLLLTYLEESEREKVLKAIKNIEYKEKAKLQYDLKKYLNHIEGWKKYQKQLEWNRTHFYNTMPLDPVAQPHEYFTKPISEKGKMRALRILSCIYNCLEKNGAVVKNPFRIVVRGQDIHFEFEEGKDNISHELTKDEARQLLEYQEARKTHRFATKPRIPKYDHPFNGKLKIYIGQWVSFRDSAKLKLEDQLKEILIFIYDLSEQKRLEDEARRERWRKEEEERERIRKIRERKEKEERKVKELLSKAEDFRTAKLIREYVLALLEKGNISEEWINWALRKADWYDPTIEFEDEIFGIRKYTSE